MGPSRQDAISPVIANSLITGAPLSEEQLESLYRHYKALADSLAISGPRFSESRNVATELGNTALDRLRRQRAQREADDRARARDDGLERIE